ncbi:YbaB/EbfC family nucleoid-associated protein [Amycolatopsis sp. Poz14]|uniref:YbaB/EbfC family nucleoid-associated protein n=1 Tax=Amycolatopsis sp. Poz14 TaxID=1447705 RepID=UPI001EE8546F|nr:YbaB/EbfC family nucleoid-associated protein [Amycolatopsis sp. Poz14]MCG3757328.1 YbaB/EbfC family nucleoid-associated protein [Amycolatopsis sp. Poz14]
MNTRELISLARSREAALGQVASLMGEARGSAHALDGSVEVTVDALGALKRLWLAPSLASADPSRISALVLEVVRVAMAEAEQDCYNRVGLLLGEEAGLLVEALSGRAAPARSSDDDPGMTVEEFQRLRAERVGERRFPAPAAASASAAAESGEDEWEDFDPASLRSDR